MQTSSIKLAGWAATALLILAVGCKKPADVVAVADQGCRLQSEISAYNDNGSKQTTTHTYNDNGQLIKSVATSSSGLDPIVYTFTYDSEGHLITALVKGAVAHTASIDIATTYEYVGGRLTKMTSKSSSYLPGTTLISYSYDASGRIATYTSSEPQDNTVSYTFTNGLLTSGTITKDGQSGSVAIANGRITSITYPDGRINKFIYNANGYQTRVESLDKAGTPLYNTIYEYSTVAYKRAYTAYTNVPTISLYGKTDLPHSREAIYNVDGTLKAETLYQYEINTKGYITSTSYVQNQVGVGGQGNGLTTYSYSDCQ